MPLNLKATRIMDRLAEDAGLKEQFNTCFEVDVLNMVVGAYAMPEVVVGARSGIDERGAGFGTASSWELPVHPPGSCWS